MMAERWKEIIVYGVAYYVSDLGNVQSQRTYTVDGHGNHKIVPGNIMKGSINAGGYAVVSLGNKKKRKTWLVHRLVCTLFLDNPKSKPFVNHKNGVKDDNRLENLEWCTHSENMRHASKLRKSLGIQRKTKAVDPSTIVEPPPTPKQLFYRENAKAKLTLYHYKHKVKMGELDKVPDWVIEWKKERDKMVWPDDNED